MVLYSQFEIKVDLLKFVIQCPDAASLCPQPWDAHLHEQNAHRVRVKQIRTAVEPGEGRE